MLRWCRGVGVVLTATYALLLGAPAWALDKEPGIEQFFRDKYEFRLGSFLHGVGGREKGYADLNAEFVLPDPWPQSWQPSNPRMRFLLPRPHFGTMVNFNGMTSYVYAGALWTFPLPYNFFIEGFVGGAVHNGVLQDDPNRASLGCRELFHSGGSFGYRFGDRWSAMFTFDHLSNGNAALHACSHNQGLNQYGVRLGYSF